MKIIKSSSPKHPLAFALFVTFIFILMVLASSIAVSAVWPGDTAEWFVGGTIGRIAAVMIILAWLWRLGWLEPAGFTRPGHWKSLPVLLLSLSYSIVGSAFVMSGNLNFGNVNPALAVFATLFLMVHAFLEEATFRGLILHGFVRRSGSTNRGLIQAVLLPSLFFGAYHLVYLAGEVLPVVLLRIVYSSLLGVFLGALVLQEKSIFLAAFFHGALNVAAYLNLSSNRIEGTMAGWLMISMLMVPLAIYGIYLLQDTARRPVYPEPGGRF